MKYQHTTQKQYLKIFTFAFFILSFLFFISAPPVSAADWPVTLIAVPTGSCPKDNNPNAKPVDGDPYPRMVCVKGLCVPQANKDTNNPAQVSNLPCNFTMDNILQTGVNLVSLIIAIAGSLMLLFILYGGFQMVTSFGNAEGIQAGKKTLTAAFIGLIIIFGATILVRFAAGLILPNFGFPKTNGDKGAAIPHDVDKAMPKITVPDIQ